LLNWRWDFLRVGGELCALRSMLRHYKGWLQCGPGKPRPYKGVLLDFSAQTWGRLWLAGGASEE
jgi:hypothetical protein